MEIGRKIYYENATGNVILDTGERAGSVIETTVEQDFSSYSVLSARVPSTVGVIQLSYGQNEQDFVTCNGYTVDITGATPTLVFSYPDPNVPPEPPIYQAPLTTQVADLKAENAALQQQLAQINGNLSGFVDQYYLDNPDKA
jgi:hypothetical protein